MKYLAIDYGKKKVGLALSEGLTVAPFKILDVSSLKDALEKISYIISVEKIDKVVIGIPESGEAKKLASKFFEALQNELKDVEIIGADETLSSYNARQQMVKNGVSKKARLSEDAVAAANILQNYLDSK